MSLEAFFQNLSSEGATPEAVSTLRRLFHCLCLPGATAGEGPRGPEGPPGSLGPTGPAGSDVVFRPGVPSSGMFLATWDEVRTASDLAFGDLTVFVDPSFGAASVSPGITDGQNLLTLAAYEREDANTILILPEGSTLHRLREVTGSLLLQCQSTATPNLTWDYANVPTPRLSSGGSIYLDPACTFSPIQVPGGAVFILELAGMNTGPSFTSNLVLDSSAAAPGVCVIHAGAAATVIFQVVDSQIGNDVVRGDAGSTLLANADLSLPSFGSVEQPNIPFVSVSARAFSRFLSQDHGSTLARPTSGRTVGQTYFDTTLQIPIWWRGAAWVNAAGVVV